MRRRVVWVNGVLVAALAAVAVTAFLLLDTSSPAAAAVQTATVTTGDVTATVSASGSASSAANYGLSFNGCTGAITSISVKAGDAITVGQTLATLDPTTANAALATAQNNLNTAKQNLANAISQAQTNLSNTQASANLDISQANAAVAKAQAAYTAAPTDQNLNALTQAQNSLASTTLRSDQQVASARTALTQAQASSTQTAVAVANAETAVASAQQVVNNCTLVSPIAGTAITVNGAVGSTPGSAAVAGSSSTGNSSSSNSNSNSSSTGSSAGATVSTSSGFITVSDLTKILIPATVTESDIGAVKVGDSASVTFAALTNANGGTGTTVAGSVTSVDQTSTVSNNVVSYGIKVTLNSVPANLRLGQSATITITTSSKTGVTRLASNAITSLGGTKTVQVRNGKTTERVTVTTGLVGNGMTEILSGLTPGQVVVIPSTTSSNTGSLIGPAGGGGLLGGGR